MIAIPMVSVDVFLGVQWLQSLETMAFIFQEIFMKFLMGRKIILVKGYHRETKQGDKI